MNFQIHTFGCKVNTYDSGLLEKRLNQFELEQKNAIHILNTCAVTAEATKEAVRTIRKLKARDPFCTVVVTGCAAQVDTDQFADLKGADLVVANSHKGDLENIMKKYFSGHLQERIFKSNIFKKEDLEEGGGLESDHTRSFVKIQDGCNSFCTYCVIPFARGKSRSLSIAGLSERIQELEARGIQEAVLTGVHIGDYRDGDRGLEDLIEALLKNTRMARFRLSSLEPVEISDRLLELYQNARLCKHFHMSIQSANSNVLAKMKRQYSAEDVEIALTKIDRVLPSAFVGMDVIAGFPTETEEEFADTYERLNALPWTRLHVFPYSRRPGTKAAQFTDLPREVVKARARRLRELSAERFRKLAHEQVGQVKQVLGLSKHARDGVKLEGLARDYWPVAVEGLEPGRESNVQITSYETWGQEEWSGRLQGAVI